MKPLSQMNVIPFIDVMLVLLAVVLTTATFVAQGKIPVALPSASQAEALQDMRSLEITIDASGQVFLAERPLSLAQLDERLADVSLQDQLRLRVDLDEDAEPHGLNVELTRHLTAIASISSNAPYIGLLGTVLGLLITFHDLSSGTELSASAVMLGLALALKATAAGLLVAIPATLIYNGLVRRVDVLTARWNALRQPS